MLIQKYMHQTAGKRAAKYWDHRAPRQKSNVRVYLVVVDIRIRGSLIPKSLYSIYIPTEASMQSIHPLYAIYSPTSKSNPEDSKDPCFVRAFS